MSEFELNDETIDRLIRNNNSNEWKKLRETNPSSVPDFSFIRAMHPSDPEYPFRDRRSLSGFDFSGVNFAGLNFTNMEFENCSFYQATLSNVNMSFAKFPGCTFLDTKIDDALCCGVDFTRVNRILGVDFTYTNLERADFEDQQIDANFNNAQTGGANFTNADLRNCKNLVVDGCNIKETVFGALSKEPYQVLRRKYTGPRQIIIMILLLLFVLPFLGNGAFWLMFNQAQNEIGALGQQLQRDSQELSDPAKTQLQVMGQILEKQSPVTRSDYEQWKIWQVLIGANIGIWIAILSVMVVLYNVVRLYITIQVGHMKQYEADTGLAPTISERKVCYYLHVYFMKTIVFVAIVSAIISMYQWTNQPVWLPK